MPHGIISGIHIAYDLVGIGLFSTVINMTLIFLETADWRWAYVPCSARCEAT